MPPVPPKTSYYSAEIPAEWFYFSLPRTSPALICGRSPTRLRKVPAVFAQGGIPRRGPCLPPCSPWCGRHPNRTPSSTSYFSVGDNLLIISKIIKLGLSKSKDLIHLSNCVPATCLPRRQGGTSPFCGMFSATSSLRVATTRVLRGDSHVLGLFRSHHPFRRG